jgi:hypothetical protein
MPGMLIVNKVYNISVDWHSFPLPVGSTASPHGRMIVTSCSARELVRRSQVSGQLIIPHAQTTAHSIDLVQPVQPTVSC